jgi:membrane-associated phospholipid phosphatase
MDVWLYSMDVSTFRFVNTSMSNPFFDKLMPFLSDTHWFTWVFVTLSVLLVWKGGARGRICVLMLALSLGLGNWLLCDSMKHAVARLRPFQTLPDTILRVGEGGSFSMPSSHAANWFGLAMIALIYYRRALWAILPLALMVCYSRIYNGVHYPSDVLAGALLGAGYTAAVIWLFDAIWQRLGPDWFPAWKAQLPSLTQPVFIPAHPGNR